MRDTRRDKEYFDKFIANDKRRMKRFLTEIEAGAYPEDRVGSIKDYVHMIWTGVTIAKYSRGDKLEKLKKEYLAELDRYWDWVDTSGYSCNLEDCSLAYLLGADDELLLKMRDMIHKNNVRKSFDWITDFILTGDRKLIGSTKLAWQKPNYLLEEAITNCSAEPLKTYLSRWYNTNRSLGWYDSHKDENTELYFGYWCFEVAAIAKRLGIDDILIRDNKYYPRDLTE